MRVGDEVRLRIEGFDRILGVNLLLNKRVSYPQARTADEARAPAGMTTSSGVSLIAPT